MLHMRQISADTVSSDVLRCTGRDFHVFNVLFRNNEKAEVRLERINAGASHHYDLTTALGLLNGQDPCPAGCGIHRNADSGN